MTNEKTNYYKRYTYDEKKLSLYLEVNENWYTIKKADV